MGNWRHFHLIKVSYTVKHFKGVQICTPIWSTEFVFKCEIVYSLTIGKIESCIGFHGLFDQNLRSQPKHYQARRSNTRQTPFHDTRSNQIRPKKLVNHLTIWNGQTIPEKIELRVWEAKRKQWTWLLGCILWVRWNIWGGRMERFHPPRALRVTPACPRGHQDLGQVNLALFESLISAFSARREVFMHLHPVHKP